METLQIQEIGSVVVNPVVLNDELDKKFKPGLYLQVKNYLENDFSRFCTIDEQQHMIDNYYLKMGIIIMSSNKKNIQ